MREPKILARAEWRATAEEPLPDVSFVPALARRRLTPLERAGLAVAHAVWPEGEEIPVVFASRWGEIGTTFKLMRQFHDEGEMSPAAFSVSVHNALPGAFSLFTHNHAPYTAIAARARTREMGWLEACAMRCKVLFVYAEESTPAFYEVSFGKCEVARAEAILLDGSDA